MNRALLLAAVLAFSASSAAAETKTTYISPSIILLGEPAPAATDPTPSVRDTQPMPRVITGATETERDATTDGAGVSTEEQTGAISEPPPTEGAAPRSTLPAPETTDTLRGPIIPAPPANTVERMQE